MLERMRRSSQSLFIWLFFGIIILVFVINFGPQASGGCDAGPGGATDRAASIEGRTVSSQDFRYAYMMFNGPQIPPQIAKARRLKETIMDKLIERELLAKEAHRLGMKVSDEEVEDMIADSRIVALGFEQSLTVVQKDGKFDYETFKKFAQYQLGMSVKEFIAQQRRELLALRMRELLRQGANISVDEVKTDFVRRGDQVNLEYLRFPARRYEGEVEPTAEEIAAYAKANEAKLQELYNQRKFMYEKAPKERKLRQILVKVDTGVSPEVEEAAKKKAEALAARIKKGESFAAVAKAASDHTRTKGRAGELGWRRQGATELGPSIEEKVWKAKDGEVVGPEKGADGFYLLVAEGSREGDIKFEQVSLELAEDQLRQEKMKARAKADAEAALAKAKAQAGKALKDIFPAPTEKPAENAVAASAIEAPQAEETGLFARRGAVVEGIGTSPELAKAAFSLKSDAPYAGPVEVAGSYIVVKLKERKEPDMTDFDKRKVELVEQAAAAKGEQLVEDWALKRCQEVKDAKKIDVNRQIVSYGDGPEGAVAYEPCAPPRL